MIIVDTNVLSEVMRERPDRRVVNWFDHAPKSEVFTTAVTKAEILYGIAIAPEGRKRTRLAVAADRVFKGTLAGRVLPFDDEAAEHYARIASARRTQGRRMEQPDAEIAAIARVHNATLATRNTSDFEDCGIRLVNPWEA